AVVCGRCATRLFLGPHFRGDDAACDCRAGAMTIPEERLAQIANRFAELEARLASGQLEGEAFVAASRDYAELEPVAKAAQEVREMRAEIAQLAALAEDPEMKALADEELAELREKLPEAERRLAVAMLPRDAADARPAML